MTASVERRRTPRLVLRRPLAADVSWVAALHADPRNYEHAPGGAHAAKRARELAETTVTGWDRHGVGYWMVELDGAPVGMAGLAPMRFHARPCFNLYYRFVTEARGRGLASETGREALAVAGLLDPVRPVVVRTRPDNGPARRLAESLGLVWRPELEKDDGFLVYASGW